MEHLEAAFTGWAQTACGHDPSGGRATEELLLEEQTADELFTYPVPWPTSGSQRRCSGFQSF
ncbi:hypothetical protein AB0B04_32150 [Streptomyces xinghaiensis]|uniref:hypothetical protein n=1 Tax=Streptomyces TaxID=1883 RepID=UPI000AA9656E|nr:MULTISPECIES: hypothetical protein [Streptomyces]